MTVRPQGKDGPPKAEMPSAWVPPDGRRKLQLVLATIWLLDGILQLQPIMFTRTFGSDIVGSTAAGNPAFVSHSISWSAHIISNHAVITNTAFALIQTLLGLGIAWRPTAKFALAGSVVWSLSVWWFGEGLGGVLINGASPLNGAPGAVLFYGLAAVLLWPVTGDRGRGPFIAAGAVGLRGAKAIWVVLWGGLAFFALFGTNRSASGVRDQIVGMAGGEPAWMAWIDHQAGNVVNGRGLAFSIALACLFALIAVGVFLTPSWGRATIVVALVVVAIIWIVGQNFGEIFAGGMATDPNSGPLLALIALAFWPRRPAAHARGSRPRTGAETIMPVEA
jgi:hypothetical protein